MKDFPTKLTPNNLEKFKHYRTQRNICKLKQFIYKDWKQIKKIKPVFNFIKR